MANIPKIEQKVADDEHSLNGTKVADDEHS